MKSNSQFYPFTLPKLSFGYADLEPVIDKETTELHYSKHHQTYVDKLNAAIEKFPDLKSLSLAQLISDPSSLPDEARDAIINHGGGHANHSLFWEILRAPKTNNEPTSDLLNAINLTFGSFPDFKTKFSDLATMQFGSGWAWLCVNDSGQLSACKLPNQNSPLAEGLTPILCLDVWEHAYYLKYQNRRADYIKAWWDIVNWDRITELYLETKKAPVVI
ncbi:MAG: superoxide dismutase [candidate division WWE3 bacterium]|nr:superoxide dismutase [candidate division WWE3 bacterium]